MATDPIIDIERVRQDLNDEIEDDDAIAYFEDLILVASNVIENICGQPVVQREEAWQFYWLGPGEHTLLHRPVSDLSLLRRFLGIAVGWETIDESLYTLVSPEGCYTLLYGGASRNGGLYEATYSVGYPDDAIPPIIRKVCSEMVEVMHSASPRKSGYRPLDVLSVATNESGVGLTETKVFRNKRPDWELALQPYTL